MLRLISICLGTAVLGTGLVAQWLGSPPLWAIFAVATVTVICYATAIVATCVVARRGRPLPEPNQDDPLDITATVGSYTSSPASIGAGIREWIVRVDDLLLVNREPRRLDLQPLLWVKAKHGGYRSLRPSIPCRNGVATMQTEVGSPPHLPTEIPLLPDGGPQRGHIDFVGLYADDEWALEALDEVELELSDIRHRRSLRIRLNPR